MRKISFIAVAAALACGGSSTPAPTNVYVATLSSSGEFPAPPNPNATATGTATFTVNASSVDFTITYAGLSGPPTAAHIHPGAAGTANPPIIPSFPGLPTTAAATFSGTFQATDIKAGGGIAAGDLNGLVAAMKAGTAYANIHTAANPNGEIRGQINPK
ncbi:MAG TPA: CHRD domain-containing protein [Myxococcales bacterium]|nr:CHRD domain-containing protein [Myxococcales bacterium]